MNILNKIALIFSKFTAPHGVTPLLGETIEAGNETLNMFDFVIGVFVDILYKIFFAVSSLLLTILDIIQISIYRIMGIDVGTENYIVIDPENPVFKFLLNDTVSKVFRYMFIIAFILVIVFTIFSIVMSEYKASVTGSENRKGRIAGRSLRSILLLFLFPMVLIVGIVLTNALLVGFNSVFYTKSGKNSTMGSNLFVMSASSANKYRNYATDGTRVPILIDFDDPYKNGSIHGYTTEELLHIYDSFQFTGQTLYQDFAYNDFDQFNKTLVYKNNTLYNASTYAGFEKFIVTPEQYYVMGDFVEYAMKNNVSFYIKNIKDDDIEWKYVDKTIFDKSSHTLTITYSDASDINATADTYTVSYSPTSLDVTTPIADAFDTISNILAIGDYKDNLFNIMSREEDSINVVNWETDKVYLKLSENYKNNPNYVDKLILYEYYRYEYNNSLDYELSELESGILLPLYQIDKRVWRPDLLEYITVEKINVAYINGSYYRVYQPNFKNAHKDTYGDICWEIIDPTSYNPDACEKHDVHFNHNNRYDDADCTIICTNNLCTNDHYYIYDYHTDGTICYDAACTDTHLHKTTNHLTAIVECDDLDHYGGVCSDAACVRTHYHINGTICPDRTACAEILHMHDQACAGGCGQAHYVIDGSEIKYVGNSAGFHHYFNNYPLCDGTEDCDEHNHYHFDGSRFTICYDSCYEEHYHKDGTKCDNVIACSLTRYHDKDCTPGQECAVPGCTNDHYKKAHYHTGDPCESPYCSSPTCVSSHYHANGEKCDPSTCTSSYHRHTSAVCGLQHLHSSDNGVTWTTCSNYEECTVSMHRHNNDWSCSDPHCLHNHYHDDGTYCNNVECGETIHRHDPCDGCYEDHYYYVEPYYEKCALGIENCDKYHYHKDGDKYVDCINKFCGEDHYHYIYPSTDRCIFFEDLTNPFNYTFFENETFSDILEYKFNGPYTQGTIVNGIEVEETTYYDDIVSKVLKEVNWPQKLAEDLQTIYDEINLNLLITSGDWLTKLSEMIGSSMSNGFLGAPEYHKDKSQCDNPNCTEQHYFIKIEGNQEVLIGADKVQSFDTSLIHPIGLMVSELFLNEIAKDRESYFGEYEFTSSLSEQDIRSLLLAVAGEDNYRQLSLQVEYFKELFNIYMEPVLEEVAKRENFDLVEGQEMTEQLYTYKAYLCSVLMSRTCMEYLFDSTLAYIGASNFSYAILTNDDIAGTLEEYIKNTEAGLPALEPNVDIYLNITIGYEDLDKAIRNEHLLKDSAYHENGELTLDGFGNWQVEEGGNPVNIDFDELMNYDDFKGVVDAKIYDYAEFRNTFYGITEFYTSIFAKEFESNHRTKHHQADCSDVPCVDSDCDEQHYFNFLGTEPNSGNWIRDYITKHIDFSKIYDQTVLDKIIDHILSKIKIIVTPSNSSNIVSVVNTTYRKYTELPIGSPRNYQTYLSNNLGTGILNLIESEMRAEGRKDTSPDYEYVRSLRAYVAGNMERWEYVTSSNYSDGGALVGKLGSLEAKAEEYISQMGGQALGSFSGLFGLLSEKKALDQLDQMHTIMMDFNNARPDEEKLDLPETKPSIIYATLLDYAQDHIDDSGLDLQNWTLFNFISTLMEQAKSTSENTVFGYKASTQVLSEISSVMYNYINDLTSLFDFGMSIFGGNGLKYSNIVTKWQSATIIIDEYLNTLKQIDTLNKYYVIYAVSAYVSTHLNTEFDIIVNSKHYKIGSNMSPGKLTEFVLGAEVIREMGYACSFVEDDYEGLVRYSHNVVGGIDVYKLDDSLSYLNDFICGFGETAMTVYNQTNFIDLSTNALDELVITSDPELMMHLLEFLTQHEYLPTDILMARFGLEYHNNKIIGGISDQAVTDALNDGIDNDDIHAAVKAAVWELLEHYYNKIKAAEIAGNGDEYLENYLMVYAYYMNTLDYLFINEVNKIDYAGMTLKDLRLYTIQYIIDYEQLAGETEEQNQKRYLALFYLACADWSMDTGKINNNIGDIFKDGNSIAYSLKSLAFDLIKKDALAQGLTWSYDTGTAKKDLEKKIEEELARLLNDIDFIDGAIQIISPVTGSVINLIDKVDETNPDDDIIFHEADFINGLKLDSASVGVVLKLAGVDNRPYEEIVGLEYSINFDWDEADEADGDLFVVCTYDEENYYYVPFMMTNTFNVKEFVPSTAKGQADIKNRTYRGLAVVEDGGGQLSNWLSEYKYYDATTDYYACADGEENNTGKTCFYPILARGAFDENNRPTAIRQSGKDIQFYRDDIVIHEASDIGLETYYVSVEDAYTGGILSQTVNAITKFFTGKSLTQMLVENIPRFDINFSLDAPYGTKDVVTDNIIESNVEMNYSFSGKSLSRESIYDEKEINAFLLTIAIISVFSFIFKALWGVIGRILEITALYILGPITISTIAFKADTKGKDGNYSEANDNFNGIYDRWKSTLVDKILLAFGYVFGLNIFYLLIPMVEKTRLFTTTEMFVDIPLMGKLPVSLINFLGTLFLTIALASAIVYAPKLLAKVMQFTDGFAYGEQINTTVQNTIKEAQDFISGQRAMDAVNSEFKNMKNMIPGIAIAEEIGGKIKDATDKAKVAAMKVAVKASGVGGPAADAAVKAYEASMKQQKENKKKYEEKKEKERAEREKMREQF